MVILLYRHSRSRWLDDGEECIQFRGTARIDNVMSAGLNSHGGAGRFL